MDRDQEILDLQRQLAELQDALKTFKSSPQDDVLGSKQRAFTKQYLKGNGHVVEVVPNATGDGLTVKKVS